LLLDPTPVREFLLAGGQYRGLGAAIGTRAERQGLTTWETAVQHSIGYWRDPRATAVLRTLLDAPSPAEPPKVLEEPPRREGNPRQLKKLESKLTRAREESAAARAEAEARLVRLSAAEREAAEARQGRDRAAARLQIVEAENAELREALRLVSPAPAEADPIPARTESSEPALPLVAPSPPPSLETVFKGRLVYLYTGVERADAREGMGRALESHGAICEVYDANRIGQLGPDRFPPESLVIIETSHLGHSTSGAIQARARASGAWSYVGATGSGALARRVAERWWKTHPRNDHSRSA
jgi:hypothetical protein